VFTPKYRKKLLFGQIRRHLGTVLIVSVTGPAAWQSSRCPAAGPSKQVHRRRQLDVETAYRRRGPRPQGPPGQRRASMRQRDFIAGLSAPRERYRTGYRLGAGHGRSSVKCFTFVLAKVA
jgi:hypothetical protein